MSFFLFYVMAPILISHGQSLVDEYRKEILVEEYLRERGNPVGSVTDSPAILAQDDAKVNLDTDVSNSSSGLS